MNYLYYRIFPSFFLCLAFNFTFSVMFSFVLVHLILVYFQVENFSLDVFNNDLLQKDDLFLNLILEYIPETVYRVARHYSKQRQIIPALYIKVCFFNTGVCESRIFGVRAKIGGMGGECNRGRSWR